MSSLAAKSVVLAHRAGLKVCGVDAVWRRGDDSIEGLRLLPANVSAGMRDLREKVTFGARTPGFKLELAKLVWEETQWTPEEGDEIEVTYPAGNITYVVKNGPNKRCWDWSDDYKQIITVYAVE